MDQKEGRVFLRGITSEHYGLSEFRRRQRAAPRVRRAGTVVDDAQVAHSGDSDQSRTWWMLGPGDDPFLTQSVQAHFVELFPGGSNRGHGHQNGHRSHEELLPGCEGRSVLPSGIAGLTLGVPTTGRSLGPNDVHSPGGCSGSSRWSDSSLPVASRRAKYAESNRPVAIRTRSGDATDVVLDGGYAAQ